MIFSLPFLLYIVSKIGRMSKIRKKRNLVQKICVFCRPRLKLFFLFDIFRFDIWTRNLCETSEFNLPQKELLDRLLF